MGFTQKFYIADTHFGHEMILGHCNRPFESVPAMDRFMIDRWNDVVRENDIVYHLGDFGLCDPEYAKWAFHQLKGRKVLVLGNHDCRRGPQSPLQHIVDLPWDQPPAESLEVKDGGCRVFLSHYAHLSWQGSHRDGSVHFFGHSHGNLPHPAPGKARDVGVDLVDVGFTPRTFQQLTAGMPGFKAAA